MKQSIGTSTVFKMILIFTLLFAAFLALAVTYNRVYKLKNETISILEKYEGANNNTLKIINNYLRNNGYSAKGTCASNEYGMISLDSVNYEAAGTDNKYYYCISYNCSKEKCTIDGDNTLHYNIRLFFKFNLPFFGDLTVFNINGETKEIKLYSENQKMR